MQFSSGFFLMFFLPITMLLYKSAGIIKNVHLKNLVLLLASLIFYAWGEPVYIFIMILSIFFNYYIGIGIDSHRGHTRKILFLSSIIFNLGNLIVFKYLTFIISQINRIVPIKVISIALPIGISFYTFQIMSYVIDVYYKKVPAQKNLLSLALYITMFPQLVAGPIVRYSDIIYEIDNREETSDLFIAGCRRFVIGLSKKIIIADLLAKVSDKIFTTAQYSDIAVLTAWIGALAYTFQIYYDFSGYSDMAIGLGQCFGFHFKENFNYPYFSSSINEFWRKWHISLTDWFRDYVYIPLGGNRVSPHRHLFNLFIVWLLTGIWHGAAWTFVVWGLYHFAIQMIEKKFHLYNKIPQFLGYIMTMFMVTIGWVIFKASNLSSAVSYIQLMFGKSRSIINGLSMAYLSSVRLLLPIAFIGSLPIKNFFSKLLKAKITEVVTSFGVVLLLIIDLLLVINGSYSPFIYFNF